MPKGKPITLRTGRLDGVRYCSYEEARELDLLLDGVNLTLAVKEAADARAWWVVWCTLMGYDDSRTREPLFARDWR